VSDDLGGGAQIGAPPTLQRNIDPQLALIVRAWPQLSPVVRAGIVAMVRASEAAETLL